MAAIRSSIARSIRRFGNVVEQGAVRRDMASSVGRKSKLGVGGGGGGSQGGQPLGLLMTPNASHAAFATTAGSDKFGIATGLEQEELEAQAQGRSRFELEPPRGPFGTKNDPAIVKSQYDERIVGCSGGVGEDEHDVIWFKLKKGEQFECSVCTQVFQLEVIGEGGLPGHGHH